MGLLIHLILCFAWGVSVAHMFKGTKVGLGWQIVCCIIGSQVLFFVNKAIGLI